MRTTCTRRAPRMPTAGRGARRLAAASRSAARPLRRTRRRRAPDAVALGATWPIRSPRSAAGSRACWAAVSTRRLPRRGATAPTLQRRPRRRRFRPSARRSTLTTSASSTRRSIKRRRASNVSALDRATMRTPAMQVAARGLAPAAGCVARARRSPRRGRRCRSTCPWARSCGCRSRPPMRRRPTSAWPSTCCRASARRCAPPYSTAPVCPTPRRLLAPARRGGSVLRR